MKKIFYSLIALLSFFTMNATTFYVNPSADNASDDNAGTKDAPWATFNSAKWTDGCTVTLLDNMYIDATAATIAVPCDNVTITGENSSYTPTVYGYDDTETTPGDYSQFFSLPTKKTLTVKNVDFKNFNNSVGGISGAIFNVATEATLNLENVTIAKVLIGTDNGFGGAIYTSGTLNCTNVNFESCVARQGGAIYVNSSSPVTLEGCKFINNTNNVGVDSYERGGAIAVLTNFPSLSINNCYFEGNECKEFVNTSKYPSGGAICLRGIEPKLHITNSTFSKNVGGAFGGAIYYEPVYQDADQNIDLLFTNDTFIGNTLLNTGTVHGECIYINGGSEATLKGKLVMVNNTFCNNNSDVSAQSEIFMNSHPIDLVLVNNLGFNEKGWGWVFQENAPNTFASTLIFNNIINKGIGGGHSDSMTAAMGSGNNYFSGDNTTILLDNTLTVPTTGVPYLKTQKGSLAINNGLNSYTYGSGEIVPTLDVCGSAKVDNKDVGAYEYTDSITGLATTKVDMKVYPNPFVSVIYLSSTAKKAEMYNTQGALVLATKAVAQIATDNLSKGMYILVVTDNSGNKASYRLVK